MMNETRIQLGVQRCQATVGHIMLHLSPTTLLLAAAYMQSCGSTEPEVTAEGREYNILSW